MIGQSSLWKCAGSKKSKHAWLFSNVLVFRLGEDLYLLLSLRSSGVDTTNIDLQTTGVFTHSGGHSWSHFKSFFTGVTLRDHKECFSLYTPVGVNESTPRNYLKNGLMPMFFLEEHATPSGQSVKKRKIKYIFFIYPPIGLKS